jgi:hypothetical protein
MERRRRARQGARQAGGENSPPPKSLPGDLLRRMIANRIQEEAFGTLDRATLNLLDGLARRDGARRGERRAVAKIDRSSDVASS